MIRTVRTVSTFKAKIIGSVFTVGVALSGIGCASQNPMLDHVTEGVDALKAIQTSGTPVDPADLKSCAGVAMLQCFQAGVVFGGMGGNGVVVKKLESGWSPPVAIGIVQGDFGPLIGAQHMNLVMVFEDTLTFDKFIADGQYFCAGAGGTAGSAHGATEASGPPVKLYAQAAGLYGGASIGGVGIIFKEKANAAGYGAEAQVIDILNGKFPQPPGGVELSKKLDAAASR